MPSGSTRTRRVTISDVAKHAGVSTTAVSKVLRKAYGASPDMHAKVRSAIDELGYRPSAAARGMRGQTYTIGVTLPDFRNPFFADVLDGVTAALAGTDYVQMLSRCCNDQVAEAHVHDAMIDRSMDGLILVTPTGTRKHLERIARTVPTVVVGRHGTATGYDTVADDDFTGAGLVIDHLATLGHTRIAHIEHLEPSPARRKEMPNSIRADGYRHAMRVQGLAEFIDIESTSYSREGGYLGAQRLLARDLRPTAIFAGADIVAMGVLDALTEAGLSVPDDISLVGYDNTVFAAFAPVSLTTVDQAGHRIGFEAARLLLDRIATPQRPTQQVKLSPALVTRRTTAPIDG
jgi:LacI family transcriptional regulator